MSALTVLLVGAFSTFVLLVIAIKTDMEAAHYATARALAQRQIEQVRTKVWASMPASGSIAEAPSLLPGGSGQLTVTPMTTGAQTGMDHVTVNISWVEPGRGSDAFNMDTYVCDGGLNTH